MGVPRLTHCPAAGKQEEVEEQPPHWRHKNKTVLFSTSCLWAEAGQLSGRPRASILPVQANVAQGWAEVQGSRNCQDPWPRCLALDAGSWTRGRICTRVGECHGPSDTPSPPQSGSRWFSAGPSDSTKARVFLALRSFIQQ